MTLQIWKIGMLGKRSSNHRDNFVFLLSDLDYMNGVQSLAAQPAHSQRPFLSHFLIREESTSSHPVGVFSGQVPPAGSYLQQASPSSRDVSSVVNCLLEATKSSGQVPQVGKCPQSGSDSSGLMTNMGEVLQ